MPDRLLQDADLNREKALPAANATASTASVDLGSTNPGAGLEPVEVEFAVEALPSLVDTKKCTLTMEDSADDSSFAAIAALATLVSTGASGAGAAANSRRIKLPPNVRRYVRVSAAVEAAGGDNTAKKFFLRFYF